MADTPTPARFASAIAPLQWRDAPADTVEKECEKEFSAHRPCGHNLDKIRKTANLGPDLMVCGAHSKPARDAETFSAERYHLVVPEAMRLEQLDPFSGPSPSWYDKPNLTEWEQVLARAPDKILADAHELGPATDRMARGDAPEPFRIEITEITEIGVEITEIDVETNPAANKRGGTAATLRNHNDDVGKTSEARVIEGHSGADGKNPGFPSRFTSTSSSSKQRRTRGASRPARRWPFSGPVAPSRSASATGSARRLSPRRRASPRTGPKN